MHGSNGGRLSIRVQRFADAARGVWVGLTTQTHMKIHTAAVAIIVGLAAWAGVSREQWALLLVACAAVLAMEVMNTAVEAVVDLVSPDYHPLARDAKDAAAGAVLLAAAGAAAVGLLVLVPAVWAKFTA